MCFFFERTRARNASKIFYFEAFFYYKYLYISQKITIFV